MDSAFIAVFLIALVFSVITFFIIEDDLKRQSERVIYVLLIVMVAWPVSLSLMQAPGTSTTNSTITGIPLNCVINAANAISANSPSTVSCGTTSETISAVTNTEQPFPTWAFYSYATIALGLTTLFTVLFVKYMLEYGWSIFVEGLKTIRKKR